jgi:putative transposase
LEGVTISQAKIRRICRNNGIVAKTKKNQPPSRDKNLPDSKIPNLVKELIKNDQISKPNKVWSGDFSYFKVQGLWYYMATVIDNYTREIVGFSLSTNHNTDLIIRALNMAVGQDRNHHNNLKDNNRNNQKRIPQIFHSDQGSEYTSLVYQKLLNNLGITQSNTNKSSPWENGYQESFYGKFKQELKLYKLSYCQSYMDVYNLIASQINYYNNQRIHTSIKNIPARFYQQYLASKETSKLIQREENNVLEKVGG